MSDKNSVGYSGRGELDVDVTVHWGCQLVRPDGTVYITRWDPTYGGHHFDPYTEAEARADVARPEKGFTKRLVTRSEIKTTLTSDWEEAR